ASKTNSADPFEAHRQCRAIEMIGAEVALLHPNLPQLGDGDAVEGAGLEYKGPVAFGAPPKIKRAALHLPAEELQHVVVAGHRQAVGNGAARLKVRVIHM